MNKTYHRWVAFCALCATMGCRTPSADWNGTWKLNAAKSSYQGRVLTISISADGEYRFGEESSHTLRCDEKDRPTGNNRTLLCVKSGVTALDITVKENGAKTRATHDELSADGKVLTTTVTEFRRNGTVVSHQLVFSRLSGSDGFAGQWLDTIYRQQHAEMIIRLENQVLHINYPIADQQIDAPLDGVQGAIRGPHSPKGTTYSARPVGRREFLTLTKQDGNDLSQGSLKLSGDGRIITESWWNPGQPTGKGMFIYEKK